MADEEHLKILEQGVEAWNQWRAENRSMRPNLNKARLSGANLSGANLSRVELRGADLSAANLSAANLEAVDLSRAVLGRANLEDAHLRRANLSGADLRGAILTRAYLGGVQFSDADLRGAILNITYFPLARLSGANLSGASLGAASLINADLSKANLSEADLRVADLTRVNLSGADLTNARFGDTVFAPNDLSEAVGLETIQHRSPSTVGADTISRWQGKIPETFLRGCGLGDWEVEAAKLYRPGLGHDEVNDILYKIHDLRTHQAIQINPLFISYTHTDAPFVDHVERHLNDKGIRFWRDVHHATAGRLEKQVDRAIRHNPTVLLVLSANSVKSDWVQHEVRLARKLEIETERDVLCPVALDDSWETCRWPERLREQIEEYHILNFFNWGDEAFFGRMFTRLIDGLDLFYKE
jgi:uncharacterized protein YjbI with pentapeptide repeats